MSTRDTILNDLKTELKDDINPVSDNYTSSIAEVKRGYFGWSDIVNKPFINFTLEEDIVEEDILGGNKIRSLDILLNGWMDEDGGNNYTTIHTLIRDLEYFFKYDFSYKSNTHVGTIRIIEGGVSAPYSYFQMDIEIRYQQEL